MKRVSFYLLVLCSLFITACECESYYCPRCGKTHYYYQDTYCNYLDGYKEGYADGYGVNAAFKNLVNNLSYAQWFVYNPNNISYSNITYIYDFDLIKPGYITVAYCKLNEYLKPVKCTDYKQYPYEIVTMLNDRTLLLNVFITDIDVVEYIVEFASNTSTRHMYLHFHDGSKETEFDCRKLDDPTSEMEFFNILY